MSFQGDLTKIRWRLSLRSPIEKVYALLSTDAGRAGFWAERAVEDDGVIHFEFPNRLTWAADVLCAEPPTRYSIRYYGGSITTFELERASSGGTILTLTDEGVPKEDRTEVIAGWVSVLMTLKAQVDYGVDLRTHDPSRTWDEGYAEN